MDLAFLGLGTMGLAMSTRLVAAGHSVTVWNRTPRAVEGARTASSAENAVRGAELVLTMLSDERAVREVVAGIAPALDPSALVIEMSTIGRHAALEVAAAVPGRFIDAPVSGSRGAAEAGSLLVLCGGAPSDVERARPVLSVLGKVEHVGPLGAGAATKLVLNSIGAQQMVALTAGLELAARMGLDPARTLDVVLAGPFATPSYALKRARVLGSESPADFTIALLEKDQRLVLEEASRQGVPMPALAAVRDVLARAIDAGLGELDMGNLGALFRRQ